MFDLTGKVAVVTGAGQGIGAAVVEALTDAGAYVYVAERDLVTGQATVNRLVAAGFGARFVQTDVSIDASCKELAEAVIGSHGRCDILVNNAGVGTHGAFTQTELKKTQSMIHLNVVSKSL